MQAPIDLMDVLELLNLTPLLPEGGYYKQTFKSTYEVNTRSGPRPCGSAIYYLITKDDFSSFHREKSSEILHFYLGDPVTVLQINEESQSFESTLGTDLKSGQIPQLVIPRLTWQSLRILPENVYHGYALMGSTLSPGFELADFELGVVEELIKKYPNLKTSILKYSKPEI